MPYKSVVKERKAARERQRRKRARDKLVTPPAAPLPPETDDPAGALAEWARATLRVPAGHELAGEPMALPDFAVRFLRDAFTVREALLCCARKNAKSAITAVAVLGHLVGPLARPGWRGAVCSVNKGKAAELVRQMREISEASDLRDLRSPTPGRVEAPHGTLDILSADASAGAASGFDLVIVDELGLLKERDRELLAGLKSSMGARNGRYLAITIHGDGPYVPEFVERSADPAVTVHLYQPEPDADAALEETWRAGNPGLGTIKPLQHMRDRARISATNPTDWAFFRAEECNLPGNPGVEMICAPEEWRALLTVEPAPRSGPCVVGLDAGGSASMTAAAVVWPETGRMEVYGAFPVSEGFDLRDRGRADAVGRRYEALHGAGELWTYPGRRTTPVVPFMEDLRERIAGETVLHLGADRFRRAEVVDYMTDAGITWPVVWRGQGASATADGSADVRAFQRAVLDRWLRPVAPCAIMVHAIAESMIRRDGAGNPALDKARQAGRIDPLQAAVIAAGLAERERSRPVRKYRSGIIG